MGKISQDMAIKFIKQLKGLGYGVFPIFKNDNSNEIEKIRIESKSAEPMEMCTVDCETDTISYKDNIYSEENRNKLCDDDRKSIKEIESELTTIEEDENSIMDISFTKVDLLEIYETMNGYIKHSQNPYRNRYFSNEDEISAYKTIREKVREIIRDISSELNNLKELVQIEFKKECQVPLFKLSLERKFFVDMYMAFEKNKEIFPTFYYDFYWERHKAGFREGVSEKIEKEILNIKSLVDERYPEYDEKWLSDCCVIHHRRDNGDEYEDDGQDYYGDDEYGYEYEEDGDDDCQAEI